MKRDLLHIDRFAICLSVVVSAFVGFADLARAEDEPMPVDSVSVVDQIDAASDTPAMRNHSCSPRTAFVLGVLIPGGGQFYLHDWSGGIQAVVSDLILVEAMRRSDATIGSMAFFIGAVHIVEGLYAAYKCRTLSSMPTTRNSSACETTALCIIPGFPESRVDRHEQSTGHTKYLPWRMGLGFSIPID